MSRESDQIQQQIQSNPELMAALRRVGLAQQTATARNGGNFWRNNEDPEVMQASQEFERLMQANGITMPHDYHMMPDGRLVRDDFIERNPWFVPTVIGSVITGGALAPESAGGMGLLSGGAAGGSAGGTTAAGEGGMTGLAGSSYTVPSATLGEAGGIGGTTAAMAGAPSLGNGAGQNGNSPYGPYAGGYQNDPNFMPPGSLQNNETWFGPGGGGSQGGSGGGNGSGLPLTALRGLAAIPAIARQFGGGNGSGNGNASMPPELQQLLAMAMQRMSQQEPLFQSINAQAMAGLPTAYQR